MSEVISQLKNPDSLGVGHLSMQKPGKSSKHEKGPLLCPKCSKVAFYALVQERTGKTGRIYKYMKLYHYDRRKTSRRRYCYIPIWRKEP